MKRLAVLVLVAACGDGRTEKVRRGAPSVPDPAAREKVAFFYRLFTSGEQTDLGGERIPTWQRIGERALLAMGEPAVDYLLAPARYREYRVSPNILANVLRIIPGQPAARGHKQLLPFLLHWLDPQNLPPAGETGDWARHFRKPIFTIFTHAPDARAVPACIAELDDPKPAPDLRREAIMLLLQVEQAAALKQRAAKLPAELRSYLFARLYELAKLKPPFARAFEHELREGLEAGPFLGVYAAGALLRLGDQAMADLLWEQHRRLLAGGLEDAAWTAVRILAEDRRDPRAYRLCMAAAAREEATLGREVARRLLRRVWVDQAEVKAMLTRRIEQAGLGAALDPRPLLALLRVDRPRVLAFLKAAILGRNERLRGEAIEFVRTRRAVPEAGPWLLELLRRTTDGERRAYYFGALTALRTPAVVPLLRAELADATDAGAKGIAAVALIAFGDEQGLGAVAAMLRSGDAAILEALRQRALSQGRDGLPAALVPAVLHALRNMPGELERLKALFILRCRGSLEGVREGLVDAYRTEPSRRVAHRIETTLRELAHR